jgi:hypothetical protein
MADHMDSCASCGALFAALSDDDLASETPSPALIDNITTQILADLRPVTPIRSERHFAAAFTVIFTGIALAALALFRPLGILLMGRLQACGVGLAVAMCAVIAAGLLVRQIVSAALHRLAPTRSIVLMPLALTGLFFALFPIDPGADFWKRAAVCGAVGVGTSLPAGGAVFMLLRRGAVMHPRVAGSAAGLFAGLVGTLVLELHCPILEPLHIVCSHVGALVLTTLAGLLASAFTHPGTRSAA